MVGDGRQVFVFVSITRIEWQWFLLHLLPELNDIVAMIDVE